MMKFLAFVAVAATPIAVLGLQSAGRRRRGATPLRGLGEVTTSCEHTVPGGGVRVCLTRPKGTATKTLRDSEDACRLLAAAGQRDRESFYTVAMDARNRVLGVEEAHKGSLTGVEVTPREVFKSAVLMNAAGILVAHNHPSGDPSPSPEDLALTRRLRKVGDDLGIPVVDHLVIGDNKCVSIATDYPDLFQR